MSTKNQEIQILQITLLSHLAASYPPISLLSVCYKPLECTILQRIFPTVEDVLIFDQAGYRHCRSTCDQVKALTTFIENGFEKTLITGAVFLDLTAAYDTIWHTGLLYKLSKCLPSGAFRQWNCCYETAVSGSIWEMMSVPGEGRQMVCPRALSSLRHSPTYIPMTFLLHVSAGLTMAITYAVPSKRKLSLRQSH